MDSGRGGCAGVRAMRPGVFADRPIRLHRRHGRWECGDRLRYRLPQHGDSMTDHHDTHQCILWLLNSNSPRNRGLWSGLGEDLRELSGRAFHVNNLARNIERDTVRRKMSKQTVRALRVVASVSIGDGCS